MKAGNKDLRIVAEYALMMLRTQPEEVQRVATMWRQIADEQTDPGGRAGAILNIASALDHGTTEDRAQAIAMTDRALALLGPKHPQAAAIYLSGAQRLILSGDPIAMRKALEYLHIALAVPKTAGGRDVLIGILQGYSTVAPIGADFSKLPKAQRIFDRLRKSRLRGTEMWPAYVAMIRLFSDRWKMEGHRPSFGKAIQFGAEALAQLDVIAPGRGFQRASLQLAHALLLLERNEHDGSEADFDAAVALLREAATTDQKRGTVLNSLALALMDPTSRAPTQAEFDEAYATLEAGLACSDDDEKVFLKWSMANWHLLAYQRGGAIANLDRAIEAIEIAAEDRANVGNKILFAAAHAYHDRFTATRSPDDIDRAIEFAELGLTSSNEQQPERWRQEVTAANVYQERALHGRSAFDSEDAARAAALFQRAIDRLPRDSIQRESTVGGAIGSLVERWLINPEPRLMDAAAGLARMLPDNANGVRRLIPNVALNLATFHIERGISEEARVEWIALIQEIASRHSGDEAGRIAANNLMHLHVGRDWSAVIDAFAILTGQRSRRLAAAQGTRERSMVLRREQSVAALAGLAYVHLGQADAAVRLIDESQAALLLGDDRRDCESDVLWDTFDAVLYPVHTRYGAYALVATPLGVSGLLLPEIDFPLPALATPSKTETLEAAAALLSSAFPVALPKRLLVVPAGPLGQIPWAAVGYQEQRVLDQASVVVLPTRYLWRGGQPPDLTNVLIVDASTAVPDRPLRHASAEARQLRYWMPQGRDLKHENLSLAAVVDALSESTTAHFASHGISEADEPMASRLLLTEDEALKVSDILGTDCSRLSLVTLSACQTAVHGDDLADEFTNVAAAFVSAGARCAIGSLWNVNDIAASLFSRRFYWLVKQGHEPRDALRQAQLWLRDARNGELLAWLTTLEPDIDDSEQRLRDGLARSVNQIGFADMRYWGAFVCYG
ncbi:CHAT domain-containing protein [Mesorhizobium sp. ISC11]|uniref:CHAT domain-containing protein n=1 Tax=Mesorhizobium sp. ISC11 TaxID=3076428 RepID=UPI00301D7748